MAIPPDDLFRRQEIELVKFSDRRVSEFLRLLNSARADITSNLRDLTEFEARRVARLTAQIDEIMAQTVKDMRGIGTPIEPLGRMVQQHLQTSASIIAERSITFPFDVLNPETLRKFSQNELIKCTTLVELEKQRVKGIIFSKVGVKGQNPRKLAAQLTKPGGPFEGHRHMETILRTETSTVYNQQTETGLQAVNDKYDLGLNRRIFETLDNERNHPISQVLNGQVAAPGQKFKASVSEVRAKAAKLKRRSGGIFWPQQGGYYIGTSLPAHYNERGRVVPTEKPVNVPT